MSKLLFNSLQLKLFLFILSFPYILYSQSPEKIVLAYEEAHNEHDIPASLNYYVEDVQFDLVGVWLKNGKDQMRALAEWDAALNSNLDFHIEDIRGDSVFCTGIERNDWFKAVGIDPLIHDQVVFVVRNGLIHRIMVYPSLETGQKIDQILQSLRDWSNRNKDQTMEELLPGGQFIYTSEAAEKWMKLLQRWKE